MPLFFALTLFVSATLLFLVQPMVGRMVLPLQGGTPAVWNTCMVFYQTLLLLGYLYAHVVTTKVPVRKQVTIHLTVMSVPLIAMLLAGLFSFNHSPIAVLPSLSPQGSDYPVFGVLGMLFVAIALPFFAVSTSAPLLQKWFAETGHPSAKDPYFLYGASNLGSLLALLAYPIFVETTLASVNQAWMWAVGYAAFLYMVYRCGKMLWNATDGQPVPISAASKAYTTNHAPVQEEPAPSWFTRMYWLGLAFVPSSLMLGVTTHITTDIASLPLLWVIPLAMYLITFIIAFSRTPSWLMMVFTLIAPVLVLLLIFMMSSGREPRYSVQILLHLMTFFAVALVCHGELARNRPSTRYLTEFYLWMSVGGMFGGVFNALVAPIAFNMILEYRITLVLACLFLPKLSSSEDSQSTASRWWGIVIAAVFLALSFVQLEWISFIDTNETIKGWRSWLTENVGTNVMVLADFIGTMMPVIVLGSLVGGAYFVIRRQQKAASTVPSNNGGLSLALDLLLPLLVLALSRFLVEWSNAFEKSETLASIAKGLRAQSDMLLKVAVFGFPAMICYFFVERPLRFGLSVAALILSLYVSEERNSQATVHRERSFFGVVKIDSYTSQNRLVHGTTLHGTQWRFGYHMSIASMVSPLGAGTPLDAVNNLIAVEYASALGSESWNFPGRDPLTYYHRTGPVGAMMQVVDARNPKGHVGVVGLGTGSMSCYIKPGQELTFFEIDAAVVRLVSKPFGEPDTYFNYLDLAKQQGAKIDIVLGDARLKIEEQNEENKPKFAILLVDAFSSDAIPVHLLTVEAVEAYFKRIEPDGLVALHISNRHLDLEPVVAAIAQKLGKVARVMNDGEDSELYPGKTASSWVVLANNDESLGKITTDPRWKELTTRTYVSAWTDDFNSLLKILRFKEVVTVRRWLGMVDPSEENE